MNSESVKLYNLMQEKIDEREINIAKLECEVKILNSEIVLKNQEINDLHRHIKYIDYICIICGIIGTIIGLLESNFIHISLGLVILIYGIGAIYIEKI